MIPVKDSVPSRHTPIAMWVLIALNALVFVLELGMDERALQRVVFFFGLIPARHFGQMPSEVPAAPLGGWYTLITSMFLHGGWLHILFNMWTLFIFGDNVEDRMGPLRFTAFYLLCGVVAGAAQMALAPGSQTPMIGASGAIAGVLGAYLVMYPRGMVIVLVPIIIFPFFFAVPAFFYLILWIGLQIASGLVAMTGAGGGGVAWWAHAGGFAAGMLLHQLFVRRAGYGRKAQRDEYASDAGWFD